MTFSSPSTSTSSERSRTRFRTGDYDAGIVRADVVVTELVTGGTLLTDHDEFELPNYVIVREDADRDEVQDEAFEVVEEKAVRFIRYAMDLALIRAMAGSR